MISRRQTCPSRAPDQPIQPQHLPPRLPQTAAKRDPRRHPGLFQQPEASPLGRFAASPLSLGVGRRSLPGNCSGQTKRHADRAINATVSPGINPPAGVHRPSGSAPAVPRNRYPRLISPAHPHRHRRIQAARPPSSEVLGGFVSPALQQSEQRLLVRLELLQRVSLDPRNNPGDESARLAHLDNGDDCVTLLQSSEASAQVVWLRHGALHRLISRRWCLPRRPLHSMCSRTALSRKARQDPRDSRLILGAHIAKLYSSGTVPARRDSASWLG